ncbi:MAG: hypothetical protein OXR62_07385 [Ahrensia sp.]|nr:hypothetical protein [Ahrensia sp.]
MSRFIFAICIILGLALSAKASNFSLYPGFQNRDGIIEMTTDKGLVVEIVVRCNRNEDGQVRAGVMTYSKVERLFCSSKNRCGRDGDRALRDTCG